MPHIMETIALKQTVAESIQEFYNKNNFGEEGGKYERFVWIKFGFFSIPIPNFQSRSQNVYLHDVSHIVTAYDTTWKGESGVSAWEIASGGWGELYMPWLLTLWAMGLGVLFYPTNTLKSFNSPLLSVTPPVSIKRSLSNRIDALASFRERILKSTKFKLSD